MAEWWPRTHNSLELCPFIGCQILPFLKIFVTDFSGTMKARKLKICIIQTWTMPGCTVYTGIGTNGP